jgi:hypothetical protein
MALETLKTTEPVLEFCANELCPLIRKDPNFPRVPLFHSLGNGTVEQTFNN